MPDPLEKLDLWKQLALPDARALLCDAAKINPSDVTAISRLRKTHDANLLRLALDLIKARHKATVKWPENIAKNFIADSIGIEQATSQLVSQHKAQRFTALGKPVMDLCCGIGGDALGMTQSGLHVTGIDIDPIHAWMTAQNAQCPTVVMDVNDVKIDRDTLFHIDPARRNEQGRTHDLADYQPGPEVLKQLLSQQPTACLKLGPGINLNTLEEELIEKLPGAGKIPGGGEIEIISEHRHLVQAVLWTGELAKCARRATLLPQGLEIIAQEDEVWEEPPLGEISQYVMTFDASVERLGLIALLCQLLDVCCVHPQAGLLTSDQKVTSPWVQSFEVLADLPWQIKQVKAQLRKQDAGIVEVKTRGKLVNPDQLQKQLRGQGEQLLTVFILKFGSQTRTLITRRIYTSRQ